MVSRAVELGFFFRVADERGLHQHAGDVGGLEHGKTSLLYPGFVQLANTAYFAQHGAADFQAVVDLGGGAHVKQGAFHLGIPSLDVQATDQIGLVFLCGHPARCRAGRAALAQRKDAGALRAGCKKRIGVDADEQVGLHMAGLLHPHMQGHKKIGVAREVGAQGVAVDGGGVNAIPQAVGQTQHHVFFLRAAGSDGAGVFAAMTGVQRDDDQAIGGRSGLGTGGLYRSRF